MKRRWSEDKDEIFEEIENLGHDEISLILARLGYPSSAICIRRVFEEGSDVVVEFSKPPTLELDEGVPYYVIYQRDRQGLVRGFPLQVVWQAESFAGAYLPDEIFELQRRKHPRINTPKQSSLTCAPKNTQRLLTAQILDVSLEGAKVLGDLEGLVKGSVLAPLTLTLYLREKNRSPVIINIAEAVVVRETRINGKTEVAFHFGRTDADQQLLAEYIEHRSRELNLPGE